MRSGDEGPCRQLRAYLMTTGGTSWEAGPATVWNIHRAAGQKNNHKNREDKHGSRSDVNALVTGSRAHGLRPHRAGANGRGSDRQRPDKAAVARPRQKSSRLCRGQGDAARSISAMRGCAALVKQFPDVDILVNNLGIYEPKGFFEIEDADWTKMFEVNVMSGVRLTRHYLKRMLDNKDWGRVVFVRRLYPEGDGALRLLEVGAKSSSARRRNHQANT